MSHLISIWEKLQRPTFNILFSLIRSVINPPIQPVSQENIHYLYPYSILIIQYCNDFIEGKLYHMYQTQRTYLFIFHHIVKVKL
jgi:hypothetical protein